MSHQSYRRVREGDPNGAVCNHITPRPSFASTEHIEAVKPVHATNRPLTPHIVSWGMNRYRKYASALILCIITQVVRLLVR